MVRLAEAYVERYERLARPPDRGADGDLARTHLG